MTSKIITGGGGGATGRGRLAATEAVVRGWPRRDTEEGPGGATWRPRDVTMRVGVGPVVVRARVEAATLATTGSAS